MSDLVAFDEIVEALKARALDVAERYAPGGYVDGDKYWARNPGRDDRSIGSFCVNLAGAYAGRYQDFATHTSGLVQKGDMLDLIQIGLNTDRRGALEEARAFLGLAEETPAQRRLRQREIARARADADRRKRDLAETKRKHRGHAHRLWLQCRAELQDTPVAGYLEGRGLVFDWLGRFPRSIRYHPSLPYSHTDKDTGEILEGEYPCMVTCFYGPPAADGRPQFYGVHRTWLAQDDAGVWRKAPVPKPKKILGSQKGGFIRLWSGIGKRGGKGPALAKAAMGSRVYITEGIEDGLSVALISPAARVLVGITLGNLAEIKLPPAITEVYLVADNDPGKQAQKALAAAEMHFVKRGRDVRTWRAPAPFKDMNEYLIHTLKSQGAA